MSAIATMMRVAKEPGLRNIKTVGTIASGNAAGSVRQRVRNGVLRVLESLDEHGSIDIAPAEGCGNFATYAWKVPHAHLQKCHGKCHNSARTLAF